MFTAERNKGCGSDSSNGSGKKWEAICAKVYHEGCCAGKDRAKEDCDGYLEFCVGG